MIDSLQQAGGPLSNFHVFLIVSEEIRQVVDIARRIALVATNALITTRLAGESACGFGVVSSEMHVFSGNLQTMMDCVRVRIFVLNRDLADWHKQKRMLALLRNTRAALGNRRHTRLDWIVAQKREAMDAKARFIENNWLELHNELKTALNLCKTGRGYGRNARVEAAYGLEFSDTLAQVADQIEETMNEIVRILQGLLKTIAGYA
jgi:hypothetical protein